MSLLLALLLVRLLLLNCLLLTFLELEDEELEGKAEAKFASKELVVVVPPKDGICGWREGDDIEEEERNGLFEDGNPIAVPVPPTPTIPRPPAVPVGGKTPPPIG